MPRLDRYTWSYVPLYPDPPPADRLTDRFAVILGLALTGAVTQFTKITVGRPRPGTSLLPFPVLLHIFPPSLHTSSPSLCALLSFYLFLRAFLASFPFRPFLLPFPFFITPPLPFLLSSSLPPRPFAPLPPFLPFLPFPSPPYNN